MKPLYNTAIGYNAASGPLAGGLQTCVCQFCFEVKLDKMYGYCRDCFVAFGDWLVDNGWTHNEAVDSAYQDLYRLWLWSESERELEGVKAVLALTQ